MTTSENRNVDQIAEIAAEAAILTAIQHLKAHHLDADPTALRDCLRNWVAIKLPEALKDAKEATEAHMSEQFVHQIFLASFILAGIEAAKESGFPRQP